MCSKVLVCPAYPDDHLTRVAVRGAPALEHDGPLETGGRQTAKDRVHAPRRGLRQLGHTGQHQTLVPRAPKLMARATNGSERPEGATQLVNGGSPRHRSARAVP